MAQDADTLNQLAPAREGPGGPLDALIVGNGRLALRVWADSAGDVWLDARLRGTTGEASVKSLGLVRVQILPAPLLGHETDAAKAIRATLNLYHARAEITLGTGERQVSVWLWVDANRDAAHIEAQASYNVNLSATLEPPHDDAGDGTMINDGTARLICFRRASDTARLRPAFPGAAASTHGLALVSPAAWVRHATDTIASSKRLHRQALVLHALDTPAETSGAWLAAIEQRIADNNRTDLKDARSEHERWWRKFWTNTPNTSAENSPQSLDEAVHRFATACTGEQSDAKPASAQ